MLDAVSLDQLRTFIAAVDEGSFSAASRKLLRAQSVVSETISKLEEAGWFAIRAMVKRSEVIEIMEKLEALGASAILETTITNCRL